MNYELKQTRTFKLNIYNFVCLSIETQVVKQNI